MSTTAEAIRLIDKIGQDGINRETATELIDYVDKQRGDLATKQDAREAIRPIWAVMLAGFAALLTVMIYLHSDSKADVKELRSEVKELRAEVNQRFTKMEAEMREIKELLQRGQR